MNTLQSGRKVTETKSKRDPNVVSINKIALERIKLIKVLRSGYPEYHLHTTIDFESFRESYGGSKFLWTNGEWVLIEAIKDLQAAVITIKA